MRVRNESRFSPSAHSTISIAMLHEMKGVGGKRTRLIISRKCSDSGSVQTSCSEMNGRAAKQDRARSRPGAEGPRDCFGKAGRQARSRGADPSDHRVSQSGQEPPRHSRGQTHSLQGALAVHRASTVRRLRQDTGPCPPCSLRATKRHSPKGQRRIHRASLRHSPRPESHDR
jgi:hypothetical protein